MREPKIVTIGAWGHLGRVLGELDRAPDLHVLGMASVTSDDDPSRYRKAHRSLASAEQFDDYRRMLGKLRPDVAIISARIDRIAPLAIEAAGEFGCHLIVEKPLAIDHAMLRRLWTTLAARKRRCVAILNNHTRPVIAATRQAVSDGLVGEVALVSARKSYKWGHRPDWFGDRSVYGGTIPWVGIHALDFIRETTSLDITAIAAMQSNVAHLERKQCEDNAVLAMRLSNGAHASVTLDILRPEAAESHGDDYLRIIGSKGMIEAEITRNRCTLTTHDSPARELPLPAPDQECFVRFIRELFDGSNGPHPEMRRAFALTHLSLLARDAADQDAILRADTRQPWD